MAGPKEISLMVQEGISREWSGLYRRPCKRGYQYKTFSMEAS